MGSFFAYLFDLMTTLEYLAFFFGLAGFLPGNHPAVRILCLAMLATVIVETIGAKYLYEGIRNNSKFYNISVPLIIQLFLLIYRLYLESVNSKKIVSALIIGHLLFTGIYYYFNLGKDPNSDAFTKAWMYPYILGGFCLFVALTLYFMEFIRKSEETSVIHDSLFWISTGILLLYLPKTAMYAYSATINQEDGLTDNFSALFRDVNRYLSYIVYPIFSYAAICQLLPKKPAPTRP